MIVIRTPVGAVSSAPEHPATRRGAITVPGRGRPGRYGFIVAFCAFFFAFTSAAASITDVAAASELFRRGREAMLRGRLAEGCPAIQESYRLDPRPGTLFTLAECEAKDGKIATALAHYEDFLAMAARLSEGQRKGQDQRIRIAVARSEALKNEVPWLTLELGGDAPSGTIVARDSVILGAAALGIPLPIDPGEHVVTTQSPGGPMVEQRIEIGRGEKRLLQLTVIRVRAAEPPVDVPAKPAPAPEPQRAPPQPARTAVGTQPALRVDESDVERASGTRILAMGLALGGALAVAGGGACLWVATQKIQRINADGMAGRPYREDNGDYRSYEYTGASLIGIGTAALVGAGVLAWGHGWARSKSRAGLDLAPSVGHRSVAMLMQMRF